MKYSIGIDLGGTNIAAAVIDENYRVYPVCSVRTDAERGEKAVIEDMKNVAVSAAEAAGITLADVCGIGVGAPGMVSGDGRRVLTAVNLSWRDVALSDQLEALTGTKVAVANDADCAALGETVSGAAKGHNSAMMITLGTGVGGGIILDGKIFSGGTGVGTEPGHVPLIAGGEPCSCGRFGCFETYASATALIRQTRAAIKEHPDSILARICVNDHVTGKSPFDAAKLGDKTALDVLDKYTDYVALGIAGLVNVFRPEIVIIGGGISGAGAMLIRPVNEKLKTLCFGAEFTPAPEAVAAQLGNDAGIIGAGALVL